MVYPIVSQTVPTLIGMGVVSRATETMFGKGRGKSRKRRASKMTKKRTVRGNSVRAPLHNVPTGKVKTPLHKIPKGRVRTPLHKVHTPLDKVTTLI